MNTTAKGTKAGPGGKSAQAGKTKPLRAAVFSKQSRAFAGAGLEAAAAAVASGAVVVLYDENQPQAGGYLCASARKISAETVNLMVVEARGLVCLAMSEERMRRLAIPVLVAESPFLRGHAFGASIEASRGVTTGISAADRAVTIGAASAAGAGPADIVMPGHVFPIQVRSGGVLVRPDAAAAASDLCDLAGESDCAVLCAVLDGAGELASIELLEALATRLAAPMLAVGEIVAHRLATELVVERVAERTIESGFGGTFRAIVYRNDFDHHEHMALVAGDICGDEPVTVRAHSQCLTGDVFGSTRCDCGDQLRLAIDVISSEGRGVIVYMHQEGRGIGLANKVLAYALQDLGRDTVEANLELGFGEDLRDYGITAQILKDLGIRKVRLLTNNPQKVESLERYGVKVVERRSIEAAPHDDNIGYLRTKRRKLGHLLDASSLGGDTDGEDS
ncbi:MAG: GTP cyclohydrolase II [Deltaproteobacteria bacterium]|nr:GTP cyclohydrolase II [Deltaproteobacteria bacterium]